MLPSNPSDIAQLTDEQGEAMSPAGKKSDPVLHPRLKGPKLPQLAPDRG